MCHSFQVATQPRFCAKFKCARAMRFWWFPLINEALIDEKFHFFFHCSWLRNGSIGRCAARWTSCSPVFPFELSARCVFGSVWARERCVMNRRLLQLLLHRFFSGGDRIASTLNWDVMILSAHAFRQTTIGFDTTVRCACLPAWYCWIEWIPNLIWIMSLTSPDSMQTTHLHCCPKTETEQINILYRIMIYLNLLMSKLNVSVI